MNRRLGFGTAAGLAAVLAGGIALAQNTPNYQDQGGANWVVGAGGTLTVKPGGTLALTGATVTGLPGSNVANGQTLAVASGGTLALASGAVLTADLCTTPVAYPINVATTDLAPILVATRAWKVEAIRSVVATAAGGALTANVLKVASGAASSGGTALLSAPINLDAASTAPVTGALVATAGVTSLAAGDRLVFDLSDVLGATIGDVTVCLGPQ